MAKWGEIKCPKCEELEAKLAQQDALVQAAVAAAHEKAGVAAVDYVNAFLNAEEWTTCGVYNHITALITPDAQAALDRALAAERERCAKIVEDQYMVDGIAEILAEDLAAAIRKGGE